MTGTGGYGDAAPPYPTGHLHPRLRAGRHLRRRRCGLIMSQGKGVCQDFAHLGIAMYRSIGILPGMCPAISTPQSKPRQAPDEPELSVQTHAWLESSCRDTDSGASTRPTPSPSASFM